MSFYFTLHSAQNPTTISKMKSLLLTILLSAACISQAQEVMPLYPAGNIPNAKPHDVQEEISGDTRRFIRKVSEPELTIYLPSEESNTGIGVVICPGGGYSGVAIDHEGHWMAQKFNEHGIATFVLKYRMPMAETSPNKEIVPLQDAQRALQIVREHADEWSLDIDKIGIAGSSAGGHLASTAGTHYNEVHIENQRNTDLRPDFMVLNYPVISFADSLTHYGSCRNLIGEKTVPDADYSAFIIPEEKVLKYSNELQVTPETPPTYITHAVDDGVVKVENSLLFIAALQQNQVPVESFFYAKGGHGYGMDNPTAEVEWIDSCIEWVLAMFGE